jgi:phage portal protein BeeE
MINDTSGSTVWGSGIQEIIRGWYKIAFRPELERIESSIINNLLPVEERRDVDMEFNFEELLRTDLEARVRTGAQAVNAGLMTRNEWRKTEWLPPVDGGDDLTVQINMAPIQDLPKVNEVSANEN